MMALQENDEVKAMSDSRFFQTLEAQLSAMNKIGQEVEAAFDIRDDNKPSNSMSNAYDYSRDEEDSIQNLSNEVSKLK
jgi:hypothetical protein